MKIRFPFKSNFILFILGVLIISCTEEIPLKSENFESILVVEGIITNQEKYQEIKLSRSYKLEENGPSPVSNAIVRIVSESGKIFNFIEDSSGQYRSEKPFRTLTNESYVLEIETNNGNYSSSSVKAVEETKIENIRSIKSTIRGEDGVAILVSSADESSNNYYKYEYEETYKIVSYYKKDLDLIINEEGEFEVVPKAREETICYNTEKSRSLVLSSTENLEQTSLSNYLVTFIPKTDSKLAHRYSILVKQLRLNPDIFDIYQTLKNLSESDNLFSQYQPGFLNGNIFSETNENEKVIGIFTTAAVDSKRLFFSYTDYFDTITDPRPDHYGPCALEYYTLPDDLLREAILNNQVELFYEDPPGNFVVIDPRCVDCNYFGTNIKPDFWEE
ncbi:DUF4249 domain-containing protein [Salinimicrobium gaetbulicola]|uniref:DUF4249 domain-containing protein n=1 Tax=Salinimicrobium gaetbulicola TaxID=999702 RepID=A0ABW3II14_9FLAO